MVDENASTFEIDGERYPFDIQLTGLEAIALESKTGMTYPQWIEAVRDMKAEAIRWLIWVTLTRANKQPDVKYSQFDFDFLGFMSSIENPKPDKPEGEENPTPPRAQRRASKKTSTGTRRSSPASAAGSPRTGS